MEGLKPYVCIHFTRTHWLSIAIFQTCPCCVSVSRFTSFLCFSQQRDLLDFRWGWLLVKKQTNWFTDKFITPAIMMPFCNDPLWNTRRMILQDPLWGQQNCPLQRLQRAGAGAGWEHADVPCRSTALQPTGSIRPGEQTLLTLAQGQHFQFPASPPPSPSASILNQACMPFLRGQNEEKVAVDWKTAICLR